MDHPNETELFTPHTGFSDEAILKMNPIQMYINQNKSFSLPVLLNAFFRLSLLQMNQGSMSFADIQNSIEVVSDSKVSEEEESVYAGFIYESILVPCLTIDGPKLRMKQELVGKEKEYLECLLDRVTFYDSKFSASWSPSPPPSSLVNLRRDINKLLGKENHEDSALSLSSSSPPSSITLPSSTDQSNNGTNGDSENHGTNRDSENNGLSVTAETWLPEDLKSSHYEERVSADLEVVSDGNLTRFWNEPAQESVPETNERSPVMDVRPQVTDSSSYFSDPINQFLAHIRKSGMDVLFPPVVHDKVSLLLFYSSGLTHLLFLSFCLLFLLH
jgi:hypothetical protein